MALDRKLLEILACPEDKGRCSTLDDEQALYNPRLKRVRDPRRHPRRAHRRGRHRRRRRARWDSSRSAATDGISPTFEA